jgi:hypothetical protein
LVILLLMLTDFSVAKAYRDKESTNPEVLLIFRLETLITITTFVVFLFLLVLIG